MRKSGILILVIIAFAMLWQCSGRSTNNDTNMDDLTEIEKGLIASDNEFGVNLFQEINVIQGDQNIFISPLSVSMALGMTLNGAKGETRSQMENTLGYYGLSSEEINKAFKNLIMLLSGLDHNVLFEIANSIWTRKGFEVKEPFYDTNREYFDAEVAEVDFNLMATIDRINDWVDSKTHGKIKKIVDPPISPLTMMILVNAIYFKGDWTLQFDKDDTKDMPFYLMDGSDESCRMMYIKDDFKCYYDDDYQAIELPYGDGDFSMLVYLPAQNDIAVDINQFVGTVSASLIDQWDDIAVTQEVNLYLPKFELDYKVPLNAMLETLGIEDAFDPQVADFGGISDMNELHISEVFHKTYVKVDEEGTEAAAVTSVTIGTTSIGPPDMMMVDRPFMFVIRENSSGTILFVGKIIDPT